MNGKVIGCSNRCQAILDTGSSSVCGPTRLITKIQRLIGARPSKGCRVKDHVTGSLQGCPHNRDLLG